MIGIIFANGRSREGSRSIPPTAPRSTKMSGILDVIDNGSGSYA